MVTHRFQKVGMDGRYNTSRWREKEKDSHTQRTLGRCPLTPEEAALMLLGLGYSSSQQIYVASGAIFGGERRMKALTAVFSNLVRGMPATRLLSVLRRVVSRVGPGEQGDCSGRRKAAALR